MAEKNKELSYLFLFIIIFSASLVLSYHYVQQVDRPTIEARIISHNEILNKEAPSPYRYRILVPFVSDFFISILKNFISYKLSFLLIYAFYDFIAIFLILFLSFFYFSFWFSQKDSLIGTLLVAISMVVALRGHYYQPWSLLEAAIFPLSLILIKKRKEVFLGILIFLAALNRETAILIPPLYLFCSIDFNNFKKSFKKTFPIFIIFVMIFFTVFIPLRLIMGNADRIQPEPIMPLLEYNLQPHNLVSSLVNNAVFFGLFWIPIILGFRYAPKFVKKTVFLIAMYFPLWLLFGGWNETRLLMLLYPVLVTFGLSYFLKPKDL